MGILLPIGLLAFSASLLLAYISKDYSSAIKLSKTISAMAMGASIILIFFEKGVIEEYNHLFIALLNMD